MQYKSDKLSKRLMLIDFNILLVDVYKFLFFGIKLEY